MHGRAHMCIPTHAHFKEVGKESKFSRQSGNEVLSWNRIINQPLAQSRRDGSVWIQILFHAKWWKQWSKQSSALSNERKYVKCQMWPAAVKTSIQYLSVPHWSRVLLLVYFAVNVTQSNIKGEKVIRHRCRETFRLSTHTRTEPQTNPVSMLR